MPTSGRKSTSVRALRTTMGVLERAAPGLGARWVERIWFTVPARRPSTGQFPLGGTPFELSVSGATVRGRRWGHGENIVYLVHGWGSSAAQLGAFIETLLDAGFSVVAYDALSHGSSDPGPSGPRRSNALEHRDVLAAVVAAHGPAYGVVAHSLGSMVAALAMRDGIVPKRAVFVAPMIDVTSYGQPFIRMLGGGSGSGRGSSTESSTSSASTCPSSTSQRWPMSSPPRRCSSCMTATIKRPAGTLPGPWRAAGRIQSC